MERRCPSTPPARTRSMLRCSARFATSSRVSIWWSCHRAHSPRCPSNCCYQSRRNPNTLYPHAGSFAIKYRMLHFATHGTPAGQLKGTREPGLILTPPATATAVDDGYLSGSEIAGLKLDADWVILSACNSAGGGGDGEAADALSGLARVFFYAGAVRCWSRTGKLKQCGGEARDRSRRHHRQGQGSRPCRGTAPRHALVDGRYDAAGSLGSGMAPLGVGALRGRW